MNIRFGKYTANITEQNTGSNYNIRVHIKRGKDVICGFFHNSFNPDELHALIWQSIEKYEKPCELFKGC